MTNSSMVEAKNTFYDEMILIGTDKAEYYTSWGAMKASIEAQMKLLTQNLSKKTDVCLLVTMGQWHHTQK